MSVLNDFFSKLSTLTGGAAVDHLKMVFTLLASYPLALVYKRLPPHNPNIKHLFSIAIAIIVLFGVFDLADAFYTMLISSLISYAIIYHVKGIWGPILVFLYALGHLSINHIYRQINRISYDRYDPTGPQMVLVIKLTSFAFNVFDGRRPSKELTPYQKSKAIPSMPSILEYLGYLFFFGGFMAGPAFEFMDYRQFTNMEMFRVDNDSIEPDQNNMHLKQLKLVNEYYNKNIPLKGNNNNTSRSFKYYVPNGSIPALSKLGFGIFFIICTMIFGNNYPVNWTLSEEFKAISLFDKLIYIQIASFCARFKYYIVWSIAEGACILSGLGFNGYDEHGNAKWNRVTNVDIVAYETADNIKTLLDSWNMNTNKWLKNYVYLRVTPPGKKPNFFSTFATFGTSAIWHGFYPGYYLTFISGAFVQSIHRTLRRNIRPIFLTPKFSSLKPLYNFLGWLLTQTVIHYIVIPFNILSFRNSLYVWKLLYFCGHIAIILVNVTFWLGFSKVIAQIVNVDVKTKREQVKKWKVERGDFDEGKVAINETGVPLEVDNGSVGLEKEE
ncbi:MBOAT, membrane-bound O-acyltransferase family-domain-containing protein [Glomus cerebriforme]|uniref:MBOAT, membrane-bound O-acyltransferase family-domain-containing protein n=1 Tax=Glomus cerebriforme TaxID=658196 RepID=A0A397SFY3_9GLOM|nr:MBOAT, membrane-bound O-acyltransferase family-domain-containing protein [Glomus cerebriforme]